MKYAKPQHRRDYWKYISAMYAFEKAEGLCCRLDKMPTDDELFYPLMLALHTLYARPFKHPKASRNIPLSYIPNDLRSTHNSLLHMRDRIYAHHDKDSRMIDDDTSEDLFQLILFVKDGMIRPALQSVFPTDYELKKIESLCKLLGKRCEEKSHELMNKCINKIPANGVYCISTQFEGRAPLLTKSQLHS